MTQQHSRNKEQLIQNFLKGGDITKEIYTNRLDDSYLNDFSPLEVKVYGNNFDRAFKMFRSLVQKEKILSQYKQNQSYEKPSVKKRRKRAEMRQKRIELEARRLKMLSGEFEKELQKKQKIKEKRIQERSVRHNGNNE